MDVAFVSNPVYGGWNPTQLEKFLTANEEALCLLPTALRRQGAERVTVYTSLNSGPMDWEGVRFLPLDKFPVAQHDVLVTAKAKMPWLCGADARARFHWSMDVEPPWAVGLLRNLHGFVVLSKYHAKLMPWLAQRGGRVVFSPLGFDLRPWRNVPTERKNIAAYTSSPDRGLETLLLDWQQARTAHGLDALLITYDVNRLATMGGQIGAERLQQIMRLAEQPGVQFTGPIAQAEMIKLLRTVRFYVHPLNNLHGDLCGFGMQKAQLGGAKLVLNYCAGSGFAEFAQAHIPYREWLDGCAEPVPNPEFCQPSQSWDALAREQWLPMFSGALTGAQP